MGDCFYCSKAEPVVQTKAGKIRGFKMNSTYTFHGIKYADADRFQMPREVKPWKGIKNALAYGCVSYADAGSSVDGGYDPTSLLANG